MKDIVNIVDIITSIYYNIVLLSSTRDSVHHSRLTNYDSTSSSLDVIHLQTIEKQHLMYF